MGDELYDVTGHQCYRCKGVRGYTCRDSVNATTVWFCANKACLKHDSDCSKAIDRKKRVDPSIALQKHKPFEYLPIRYQSASLAGWESLREYQVKVQDWLKKPQDFLLYTGSTRTGKTFFSCACFNWLVPKHEPGSILWLDAKQLKNKCYASIEKNGYFPIIEKYVLDHEIIIIDDIAEFATSDWQKEIITTFIDMIYERQKKAIITSTLSKQEISAKISPKIVSKMSTNLSLLVDMDCNIKRSHGGEL